MAGDIDKEIAAIKTVLTALEPLDQKIRESVLDYVMRRLGLSLGTGAPNDQAPPLPPGELPAQKGEPPRQVHIQQLVQEKQPRSAIEMATIVAYYLSHKAPENERKNTITNKDIEIYFKIADFKLPTKPQFTLPNTKAAGYLDAVGDGGYKLNPVGYNLVVHSMPKSGKKISRGGRTSSTRKPRKARR